MIESSVSQPRRWRDGMHPDAVGMQIRSLGRVELPLGDALRIEMVSAEPSGDDRVHVQYHICTDAGGWALWVTCPRSELADREAILRAMPSAAQEQ